MSSFYTKCTVTIRMNFHPAVKQDQFKGSLFLNDVRLVASQCIGILQSANNFIFWAKASVSVSEIK